MFKQPGKVVAILAAAALGILETTSALGAEPYSPCGPILGVGFGPFDYRTASSQNKYLVESAHFTPDVAMLRKGSTSSIGGDIDYTLRAFPNHPRALLAMSNLGQRQGVDKPTGASWSVDCYFDRAIRWQPDDPSVRLVFGIHLTRRGQKNLARGQLDLARKSAIDDANFRYNLGLAFLDVGDPESALTEAWRAEALGYEMRGLRRRLEAMGKWREPEKESAATEKSDTAN